jgi:hypothetical protein
MIYDLLITLFAQATLVAGSVLCNAVLGFGVALAVRWFAPGMAEETFWKILAVLFCLTGPLAVTTVLHWLRRGTAPSKA